MQPMSPARFLARILDPGLDWFGEVTGVHRGRSAARLFLLAVALQESALRDRAQVLAGTVRPGAARSWWQMEEEGAVAGVLRHRASSDLARQLCAAAHVVPLPGAVWRAIEGHDLLAVGFARLLVLTHPGAIPLEEAAAWEYYLWLWRPGAYERGTEAQRRELREKWRRNWRAAAEACAPVVPA